MRRSAQQAAYRAFRRLLLARDISREIFSEQPLSVFDGRLLPLGVRRGESGDYRFVRTEAWGSRFRYRIA